jgi:hypothetical protein
MLCTAWPHKVSVKVNNGYIHLQQSPTPLLTMDYESSSDAALLEQEQQPPLNRDTSILLLDVNQQQSPHSNIINNPTSPQHVIAPTTNITTTTALGGSLRNSISPISTSPTTTTNKSQVVVNLDHLNSMQTVTTLQRNNVKNSSTNSIAGIATTTATGNMLSTSSIGNNIKASDNGTMFNNRKCKFNLLKLSPSPSSRAARSTRNRLLIVAICLTVFGIAIGALIAHLSGIYYCDSHGSGGMYAILIYCSLKSKSAPHLHLHQQPLDVHDRRETSFIQNSCRIVESKKCSNYYFGNVLPITNIPIIYTHTGAWFSVETDDLMGKEKVKICNVGWIFLTHFITIHFVIRASSSTSFNPSVN